MIRKIREALWDWYGITGLGMALAIGLVMSILIGAAAWYEWKHPCIRRGPGTCGGDMVCVMYSEHGCAVWSTSPTCQVCVERQP